MSDEKLYAEIRAAQAIAVEKLQQSWGKTPEQMAQARASLAAPTPTTAAEENVATAWARSAEHQARSLGITPVSDAEATAIQEAQAAAIVKLRAEQASQMDEALINFRLEVAHDQKSRSGLYYNEDGAKMREVERLVRETEISMIEARLAAGLPAEPAPRKTATQVAQERYDARRKAQS
jgi:hypothetical protein